jgi:hypothetical protein
MSRYQTLALGLELTALGQLAPLDQLALALDSLGLVVERPEFAGDAVMLRGSLECAGEPVALRLAAGTLDSVEDFGFVLVEGRVQLICGEVDRRLLERRLVERLAPALALVRTRRAAAAAGLELDERVEADGTRRIRLTPGS